MIEILPEQSTHEQLLNRIKLQTEQIEYLKSQLERSKRFGLQACQALTAAEKRENDLIDRLRPGL
jgi:hypothetical protein